MERQISVAYPWCFSWCLSEEHLPLVVFIFLLVWEKMTKMFAEGELAHVAVNLCLTMTLFQSGMPTVQGYEVTLAG
jgi:hypothetical protein